MNKLFILCGKSASGKDTIMKQIIKNHNYERVVSYTTRPMREGEIDGVDYNFITQEKFNEMLENGEIIEHNVFKTNFGNWHYGTGSDILEKLKRDNLICIKEPKGIKQLINKLGYNRVVPILIQRSAYDRLISSLNRQPNATDKEVLEMTRRLNADEEDFKEIESENIFKINNDILDDSVYEINKYIKGNNHLYWKCPDDIRVGDEVVITNIKSEGGKHLLKRVGECGIVFNSIIKGGIKKYKVIFRDDDTAYFHRSEIEKIEDINEKEGR